MENRKAIVLGATSGVGCSIAEKLKGLGYDVVAASSKDIDTSDLESVKQFCQKHKKTDVLVLNTGGPPKKGFFDISEEEWQKYHNQLFLGFCILLQNIEIAKGGYIFGISSTHIKEPHQNLVLSNTYRLAFASILKVLSKHYAQDEISTVNIALGPIKTKRLESLVADMVEYEKKLPMKRAGRPEEIGLFVQSIVERNIKFLSGVTINMDGSASNYIL